MSTSISTSLAAPTEGSSEPSDKAGVNGGSRSRSRSPGLNVVNPAGLEPRSSSPARPPTSAEIDAVIAAAMANAPPAPHSQDGGPDGMYRSATPLMTNMLPASVGSDGRVNLFVGNLPYRVRWQDLKDLFRKAGTVLRADVSLGQDNRSRGYGTVLMGSREDAARAIDRFNGYTWQTRTLEVRPDRLPPEYEPAQAPPQMHHPHQPNRVPMFPYVGGNQFGQGHPGGHPGGGGPGWHPQNHHRPPMQFGPPHHMPNHMGHPGLSHSPHPPHMSMGGPGRSHSPAHFAPNGMYQPPLSGQNTGSHMYGGPLGASPLAGSLSTGGDSLQRPGSALSNPIGFSPHSSSNLALPQSSSPATQPGPNSRPNSSTGHRPVSPGDASKRLPPVAHTSLGSTVPGPQMGPGPAHPHEGPGYPSRQSVDHGHVPHLEGLAHKKAILGPPGNLHDRVVFVSDLPLNMQWQELKDLLRPAGLIIRADVLVDAEGRSRGYGTALFGSEEDAARAVHLLNGYEVGGRRIRVYLERDSHHHDPRRPSQSQTDESGPGSESAQGQSSEPNDQAKPTTAATTPDTTPSQSRHQMASRVPWHLNLNNQATPPRGSPNVVDSTPHFRSGFQTTPNGIATPHFRNMHHPGPISMPPWPSSLDGSNPLSPLQTRGLPPMTPSMPGFVFNNAYPDTPPVPHHFMSMGPFSPGLPVTSPTGFAYNPFLNAAPGAPIHRPQTGGSAQLGTPTTQVFPHNAIRGAGPPGAPMSHEEYFPSTDSQSQSQTQTPAQSQSQSQTQTTSTTPPSLGQRTASQSVLNARDRLAPSGPDSTQDPNMNSLAASMALHNLTSNGNGNGAPETSTPPSPTSNRRPVKPVHAGVDLSKLVEESPETIAPGTRTNRNGNEHGNGSTSSDDEASARPERFSMDEQRPNFDLQVPVGGERRASFGDSR